MAGARADLRPRGRHPQARTLAATAREERESLEAERDEARRRLREVEKRLATAGEQEDAATRTREKADGLRESSIEAAERAQRRLDRLRGHR